MIFIRYNTISAAYSILALGAYSQLALENGVDENIDFSVLNGVLSDKQENKLSASLQPFPKAFVDVNADKINVRGNKPLYYLGVQSGFNKNLPKKIIAEGIEIYREFFDDKGNSVTTFEQGKEITVSVKVRALNGKKLSNIAVIDLLPGGFEVVRSSVARTARNWRADYVDVREDRVVYYGDFDSSLRELTYKVKLTSAGTFVIPPSYAESMYDRSIRALSAAGEFTVTAAQ
jgi:uncharacterized protein YfaS (alpha-2-macroglobulin family)